MNTLSKRDRLIEAAAQLIHERGFANTTLADIAAAAKVALGSIYYYFKTKDEVAQAILARRLGSIDRLLQDRSSAQNPRARLEALIHAWVEDCEIDARYGCPIGSLCYELAKSRGTLSEEAARPLRVLLDWCEQQFHPIVGKKRAPACALNLVSGLQGVSLIANAFEKPAMILMQTQFLKAWLRAL